MKRWIIILIIALVIIGLWLGLIFKANKPEKIDNTGLELFDHTLLADNIPQPLYATTDAYTMTLFFEPYEGHWSADEYNEEIFSIMPTAYIDDSAEIFIEVLQEFKKENIVLVNGEAGLKATITAVTTPTGFDFSNLKLENYEAPQDLSELDEAAEKLGLERIWIPDNAVLVSVAGMHEEEGETEDYDLVYVMFEYNGIACKMRIERSLAYSDLLDQIAIAACGDYEGTYYEKKAGGTEYSVYQNSIDTQFYYNIGNDTACIIYMDPDVPMSSVEKLAKALFSVK